MNASSVFLSLQVALIFIKDNYRNSLLSLISIFSIISIALGVFALIIGLSVMNGFKYELETRILSVLPHCELESIYCNNINLKKIVNKIQKIPDVLVVTPYINFNALIEYRNKFKIIQIRSIDLVQQNNKNTIFKNYISNSICKLFKENHQHILLGEGVADFLKVKIGDRISITVPNSNGNNNVFTLLKQMNFKVIGVLVSGSYLDNNIAFISLQDAQYYLNKLDSVEGIAVQVKNPFNIDKLLLIFSQFIDDKMHIYTWMQRFGYIYDDIQMIRTIIYLFMILVVFISCMGIYAIVTISVKVKNKDIAILCTMGANKTLIKLIFIWHGLLIGCIGSSIGIIMGILVSCNLTILEKKIESILHYQIISKNIYFIDFLPSVTLNSDIIVILIIELIFSLLASLYPALQANNIKPAHLLK